MSTNQVLRSLQIHIVHGTRGLTTFGGCGQLRPRRYRPRYLGLAALVGSLCALHLSSTRGQAHTWPVWKTRSLIRRRAAAFRSCSNLFWLLGNFLGQGMKTGVAIVLASQVGAMVCRPAETFVVQLG